jgi:hypothetical protein
MQPLRIRYVTTSPAEEYAARPGNVAPLADSIAALLLSRSSRVTPTSQGITLTHPTLGKLTYWHPDSIVCSNLGTARMDKVVAVIALDQPDVCHVLSISGKYIETIPQKLMPNALGHEASDSEAFAQAKRAQARAAAQLQELHQPDTAAAVDAALHNAAALQRAVTTLPADRAPHADAPATVSRVAALATESAAALRESRVTLDIQRNRADAAMESIAARRQTSPQLVPAGSHNSHPSYIDPFDLD